MTANFAPQLTFIEVPAGGSGVGQQQSDGLLGVDDVDGSDGEWDSLGVLVGGILLIQHVVEGGDLSVGVGDDGELEVHLGDFVDAFGDDKRVRMPIPLIHKKKRMGIYEMSLTP